MAARLEPRLGVTRIARLTGLDRTGVEVAAAIRPLGHVLQVANGKGETFAAARRSALGEAAELWAAERVAPEELVYGTPAALRKRAELWDGELGSAGRLLAPELWGDRVFSAFRAGRDLQTGRRVLVPAAALHCPPPGSAPIGPLAWAWTSNGMGAHPIRARALGHALVEAIERDQLSRSLPGGWTPAALARRALDPRTLPPALTRLLRRLEGAGFTARLFDLVPPAPLGLPVAGALLSDCERGPVPLTAGYACRLDPVAALRDALLEAAQSRLTDIHGARDDVEPMDAAEAGRLADAATAGRPRRPWTALPRPPRGAGVRWILGRLARAGHRAAAFDLAPRGLGIAVVKVVLPDAQLSELL